jgi:hypothetical protein
MRTSHWSTNRVFVCDRVAAWSSINTRYFGRLKVASLDDAPLDASLDAYDVGGVFCGPGAENTRDKPHEL